MTLSVLWTSLGKQNKTLDDRLYIHNESFLQLADVRIKAFTPLRAQVFKKRRHAVSKIQTSVPQFASVHRQYKILSACFLFYTNKNLRTAPRFILQFLDCRMRKN